MLPPGSWRLPWGCACPLLSTGAVGGPGVGRVLVVGPSPPHGGAGEARRRLRPLLAAADDTAGRLTAQDDATPPAGTGRNTRSCHGGDNRISLLIK